MDETASNGNGLGRQDYARELRQRLAVAETVVASERMEIVVEALPREIRQALVATYGLDGRMPRTQAQASREIGVSSTVLGRRLANAWMLNLQVVRRIMVAYVAERPAEAIEIAGMVQGDGVAPDGVVDWTREDGLTALAIRHGGMGILDVVAPDLRMGAGNPWQTCVDRIVGAA